MDEKKELDLLAGSNIKRERIKAGYTQKNDVQSITERLERLPPEQFSMGSREP